MGGGRILTWAQNYDPPHLWPLSTLIAAVPVLTLFFVLLVLKARVWVAAMAGMLMAIVLARVIFGMPGLAIAASCALGVQFGFFRIAWIIIASIFLYEIAVETGQFRVMKESIASLSSDKRLQLILVVFCFGAFLEGTGGGGAPVAIAGSFLIGLGFEPFLAATLCLVANTAPVAWGGVGNPIRVLAGVTGLPEAALSAMTVGLSMTHTGAAFPFFGTLLGWLGVAVTGTDAGSNALFGNLQKVTAERLGLSPVLMAAANSSSGVMGKMIDAQSIVVAGTATQLTGRPRSSGRSSSIPGPCRDR